MLSAYVVSLGVILGAGATGLDKPIPVPDAAAVAKRDQARLAWNRKTLGEAYEKVGNRDPRWDGPAREALELTARIFSEQVDPITKPADVYPVVKKAIDAGCTDPLIRYLFALHSVGTNFPGLEEYERRIDQAAAAMATSKYSPFRRASALRKSVELEAYKKALSADQRREVESGIDTLIDLLRESAKEDPRSEDWESRWFEGLAEMIGDQRKLDKDAMAAFERIDGKLKTIPEVAALRLAVKGHFLINYGWEARTTAFGPQVTNEQFRLFFERLRKAREALEEAWKIDPNQPHAALLMMTVERATGNSDRAAMEMWFERALKSSGNLRLVCWEKLDWLDPKWHGTAEEMVAFGRACAATKIWRNGVELLVVDAHYRRHFTLDSKSQERYFAAPEVWSDISTAFDDYLKHYPDNHAQRSRYAVLSLYAGKAPEALAQFQILGDNVSEWAERPGLTLDSIKRLRDSVKRLSERKPPVRDPDQPKGWAKFGAQNGEGRWRVSVPTRMQRGQQPGILGAAQRTVFSTSRDGVDYSVRIQPVRVKPATPEADAALKSAAEAIAKELGGKIQAEKAAVLGGKDGKEVTIEAPAGPGVVRIRLAVIGVRLYELSVAGRAADVTGLLADAFLNSLKFEQPQK